MHPRGPGHVVSAVRGGFDGHQEAGGGLEHGREVHLREAAARSLVRGLAVLLLQFGGVGHGETGTVDQKGAVAVPASFVGGRHGQACDDASEQSVKQGQGKSAAGLSIGFAGAVEVGQAWHVGTGGVTVEDLQGKEVDGGGGVEDAFPPVMAEIVAELVDRLGREPPGDLGLDSFDSGGDTESHPWPPAWWVA